jgi:hypothetical protein
LSLAFSIDRSQQASNFLFGDFSVLFSHKGDDIFASDCLSVGAQQLEYLFGIEIERTQ